MQINITNRFLRYLQIAAVLCAGLIGGATGGAGEAEAYRYVVPTTSHGGEVHIRTTVNQAYVSPDPGFPDAPSVGSAEDSISYMPTQYLIFSKSPHIPIEIKGGRWTGEGGDWGDQARNGSIQSGHRFVYELYQLGNLNRASARNQRLAAVGSRDGSHPATANENHHAADGDFHQLFNTGSVSNSGLTFFDPNYPQWNGYYVFLVKVVHDQDQNKGYVDHADRYIRSWPLDPFFNGGATRPFSEYVYVRGCAVIGGIYPTHPDSLVDCPDNWRRSVAVNFQGFEVAGNAHWLRVPDTAGGLPTHLASAPSHLAFNVRQNFYGVASIPSNHAQTSTGLHINTTALECQNAPNDYITNTDWDRSAEVQPVNAPEAEIRFPGRGSVQIDPGANDGNPNWFPSGLGHVGVFPLSAVGIGPNVGSAVNLFSFGKRNQLYIGGTWFTTGPLVGCQPNNMLINPLTPRNVFSGNYYNGRDSFSVTSGHTQGQLNFSFQYHPQNPSLGRADWRVEIAGVGTVGSGVDVFHDTVGPNQWNTRTASNVDVGGLAGGVQNWRACVVATNRTFCSGYIPFWVNNGPTAQVLSPGNGANVNHNQCTALTARVTDTDTGQRVGTRFNLVWNDSRGSNVVYTRLYDYSRIKASGSTFSADELRVESWQTNGSNQSFPGNIILTNFIRQYIPDGANVTWNARGYDVLGASDLTDGRRNDAALLGGFVALLDSLQPRTGNFRWGMAASASFHRNTRPNLAGNQTSKQLFDLSDSGFATPLTHATDGQTVRVRTTITNSGETPTPFYQIYDYLGSTRDFERPKNVNIRKGAGGTKVAIPVNQLNSLVRQVKVNNADNPGADSFGPFPTDSADYRNSAWRIDFGTNTAAGSLLNRAAGSGQLNPGEQIIIEYTVRADRNQDITDPRLDPDAADQEGNFQRRQPVGGVRGGVMPSDTHTHLYYQEDFCNAAVRVRKNPEFRQGDVLAPWLRAGRGSVHSNQGIFGYDNAGENNATFTVTANGAIFHFTGQNAFAGYRAANQKCRQDGGVDWRKEMSGNAQRLINDPHETNVQSFNNAGNVVNLQGRTYVTNDLTIGSDKEIRGTGTLVVRGTLRINGDLRYRASGGTGIDSFGVIVLGNLEVDSDVQNLVGSYYVSDVELDGGNIEFDDDQCPVYNPAATNRGVITTGRSAQQLDIQGLMVARRFDFQRYFVNPGANPDAPADAAENVYYDGRVVANTPPGFGTFRNTAAWYEIAP